MKANKKLAATLRAAQPVMFDGQDVFHTCVLFPFESGGRSLFPRVALRHSFGPDGHEAAKFFESVFDLPSGGASDPERSFSVSVGGPDEVAFTECIVALELAAILAEEGEFV